jgi:hypothetical protein
MFEAGAFSADPADPLRADAERLMHLKSDDVAHGLQAWSATGSSAWKAARRCSGVGRGGCGKPDVFARDDRARPGGLYDHLVAQAENGRLPRRASCDAVLEHLGTIWPSRLTLGGVPLGDTWRHPAIKARRRHQRSDADPQALAMALLFADRAAAMVGIAVTDIDGLRASPSIATAGLFVDAGVLRLRNPEEAIHPNPVDSELVVEWRALDGGAARRGGLADPPAAGLTDRRFSARARARRRHLGGGAAARARRSVPMAGRRLRSRATAPYSDFSSPSPALRGGPGRGLGDHQCKTSPSSIIRWCSTS